MNATFLFYKNDFSILRTINVLSHKYMIGNLAETLCNYYLVELPKLNALSHAQSIKNLNF